MSESVGLANSRYLLFEEPSAASAMKGPQVSPSAPHDGGPGGEGGRGSSGGTPPGSTNSGGWVLGSSGLHCSTELHISLARHPAMSGGAPFGSAFIKGMKTAMQSTSNMQVVASMSHGFI